jgi:hypothetical protein
MGVISKLQGLYWRTLRKLRMVALRFKRDDEDEWWEV